MGQLEEFSGSVIKRDLIKTTLNIYEPYFIARINQGFNH